ncbi:LysR family transcriptional regulator [Variovorax terrae]|uniref:LysR family transcriptional regulator n=1 Tax=Variovorax terrae TaxID=2923278 RepID=A0A9X2AQ18_9BURK|nr:LysR family transcriptional regulator [Variovorax terrae]MCJ0765904.1 LysR family transcriptional regulator [Variovorax terrae]
MTLGKISERQIEVFRTLMIAGTLSAAARKLYVSQPGLSVTLRRFEDQLGITLFERMAGRLVPTEEAHRIFEEIERVYGQFDQLIDAIHSIARGDTAMFRFGCSPSVGLRLAPKALRLMTAQHSERRYYCDVLAEKDIRDYLGFGRGACVASIATLDDPAVASTVVATGRLVCLMPKRHRLARRASVAPRELERETLISFEAEVTHGRFIEATYKKSGASRNVKIFVRFVESAISLVSEGLGLALIDEFSAIGCGPLGLVAVPLEDSVDIPVYVYWSKSRPRPRSVEEFIEALGAAHAMTRPA